MRRIFAIMAAGLIGLVIALAPTGAGAAADPVVTITSSGCGGSFCFTPQSVTITDGDTVTWSNQSVTDHTVTRCDPASCSGADGGTGTDAGFISGQLAPDGTFSHTFHGPGTYTYYCAFHGYETMHGVVVVTAAPSTSAATSAPTTASPATTAAAGLTAAPPPTVTPSSSPVAQLARTGHETLGTLAVAVAAVVLGLAAWGVSTPKRGVLPRLRR